MSPDRTGADAGSRAERPGPLRAIRTGSAIRRLFLTLLAAGATLGLASVSWLGLVVGGAAVGLLQRTLRRAVLAGVLLGVLVVLSVLVLSPRMAAGELLALTPAAYVTVGAALGFPVLGSLVRGIV